MEVFVCGEFRNLEDTKPRNMFDNLLDLVKQNAGDAIINNPAIPNQHNDDAINTAGNSIMNTLTQQASGGNVNQIMSLFQNGATQNNPVMSSITNNVSGDLAQKFNLDSNAANGIAQQLIPQVMNQLVSKTNDPSDNSFDLNGIMGALGGSGGIGGMLGSFLK